MQASPRGPETSSNVSEPASHGPGAGSSAPDLRSEGDFTTTFPARSTMARYAPRPGSWNGASISSGTSNSIPDGSISSRPASVSERNRASERSASCASEWARA
jgi:hypothetical protein